MIQAPRFTSDVRVMYDVTASGPAMVNKPPRWVEVRVVFLTPPVPTAGRP